MAFAIIIVIIVLGVGVSGLYQLLNAVWELRLGTSRRTFLGRAMLGFSLLAVACLAPYILMLSALNPLNHSIYPHTPASGSWSSGSQSSSTTGVPGHP